MKDHKRSRNASESSIDSDAYNTADEESDEEGGILSALKNLQYGAHVALRGKSKRSVLKADRLIKQGSNKSLVEALKQERVKICVTSFVAQSSPLACFGFILRPFPTMEYKSERSLFLFRCA